MVVKAEGQVPAVARKEVWSIGCIDGHRGSTRRFPRLAQRERDEAVTGASGRGKVESMRLVSTAPGHEVKAPNQVGSGDVWGDDARLNQAFCRAQFQFVNGRRGRTDWDVGPHERAIFHTVIETWHEDVGFVLEHP